MRLLVVSRYGHAPSTRPEAEIYLALARTGRYEITVVTDVESEYVARFRASGMRVLLAHPERRRDREATAALRAELRRARYDALVLYNSRAIANGVRAARGMPDLTVVAYRGYAGNLHWYDPANYLKLFHPRVDAIVCNNVGVARHIEANRWWARGRPITHVVNKGHALEWYAAPAPVDTAELGVPAGAPLVVCVANAARFKGVPYLLRAFNEVDPALGAHLVLCGRGMDAPAHRAIVAAGGAGVARRVHFPGYRDDVFGIVAAADLKVLPSIKGESLTKAVIEAMALGTCALITDIPGNEELLEHGVSGWKVPPRDAPALARAIEHLLADRGLRQNLAHAARERLAGPLSHARTVREMDAFFQRVVAAPCRDRPAAT